MSIELNDAQANGWLDRLEDPATKRGTGRLRNIDDPDEMCCLGHLADIIGPEGWGNGWASWSWNGATNRLHGVTYRGLPLDQLLMTRINDSEDRFPIAEIRQWIEKARAQS